MNALKADGSRLKVEGLKNVCLEPRASSLEHTRNVLKRN
jgi:hypothetical protein